MKNLKTDYLSIFEQICKIPHGSGNIKQIAEFCRNFAIYHGCEAKIDDIGNVIIKCKASAGYENHPIVILQGHTDMVCDKAPQSNHNFETDPLKLVYENGFLKADGTTLGGDDGIAVAFALSIIAHKDLKHPPLEILLTADEETGLYGAEALNGSDLDGRIMINIDSEEEGTLLSGCAGGFTADYSKNYNLHENKGTEILINIKGLAGGHAGAERHKKRLNAAKVLASLAKEVIAKSGRLIGFSSGSKMNAIPFNGFVSLSVDNVEESKKIVEDFISKLDSLIVSPDDKPIIDYTFISDSALPVLSRENSLNLLDFLNSLPDGIISYTDSTETLVETSLNLGVVRLEEGNFNGTALLRSSVNSDLDMLSERVKTVADKFNVKTSFTDRYPAWEFKKDSKLRDKMCEIYKDMFGSELKVDVIHAGLECGILSDKLPGLDCVSIGPDIYDIHTFNEKLDLASAERTYKFILKVLENM